MELIRRQYPVGTRIILNHMDDSQAPPPGTKGTVAYVDDIGHYGKKNVMLSYSWFLAVQHDLTITID